MRVLTLDGQRSAALHQYYTCRDLLRDELGVEPTEETVALYEAIRAGTVVDREVSRQGNEETRKQGDVGRPVSLSTCLLVSSAPPFVAREDQLAQMEITLRRALAGAGGVTFVAGEAGSGKTALLGEFARQAMEAHADLVVATGCCNAIAGIGAVTGIGDSYLPFREILQLLSGDIEAKRASAALTPEHARRLWAILPDTITALMEAGPDLLDTFVPRASLVLRAEAFAGRSGERGMEGPTRSVAAAAGWRTQEPSIRPAAGRSLWTGDPCLAAPGAEPPAAPDPGRFAVGRCRFGQPPLPPRAGAWRAAGFWWSPPIGRTPLPCPHQKAPGIPWKPWSTRSSGSPVIGRSTWINAKADSSWKPCWKPNRIA